MNTIYRLMTIGIVVSCIAYPQYSVAEDIFKASDFLTWQRKNQISYIHTSVGMAGLIVSQTSKSQAKCIDDWYLSDEQKSVDFILDTMRKYPEYHPRGIILAVMEKKCGKFSYIKES